MLELQLLFNTNSENSVGGVMVSMLASSAVDRGFEHRSSQSKDYNFYLLLLR